MSEFAVALITVAIYEKFLHSLVMDGKQPLYFTFIAILFGFHSLKSLKHFLAIVSACFVTLLLDLGLVSGRGAKGILHKLEKLLPELEG